jgi:hypothetical protein
MAIYVVFLFYSLLERQKHSETDLPNNYAASSQIFDQVTSSYQLYLWHKKQKLGSSLTNHSHS